MHYLSDPPPIEEMTQHLLKLGLWGHGETHLEVKEDALHIDNRDGHPSTQGGRGGFPAR